MKDAAIFVLVNKKGLHFHYRNRYPNDPAFTIWTPVMEASEPIDPSPTGGEKLVNTYDNGIRFQVDEFFRVFGEWESRSREGVSEDWELDCSASLIFIGQDCM